MENDASETSNLSSQSKRKRRRRRVGAGRRCCCCFYELSSVGDMKLGAGIRRSMPIRWRPVVYCCSFAIAFYCILLATANNNGCLASRIQQDEAQNNVAKAIDTGADSRQQYLKNASANFWYTTSDAQKSAGAPEATIASNNNNNNGANQTKVARDNNQSGRSASAQRRLVRRGAAILSPLSLAAPPISHQSQLVAAPLALAIEPLRAISGSKSEPPSRPQVDWSKQRPYFGPDIVRNVSVELGKTAYLSCKVFELGDKTVLWLRPRENEILTAGRYTYIGDPRFAAINNNGSNDWILEIKDVGLNDSTSYECQISTDPKMSVIINLQVKAAKARIRQGEQYYTHIGSNIEFVCEIGPKGGLLQSMLSAPTLPPAGVQQTYWYHNGNLLNYAQRTHAMDKNFSIEWDSMSQTSRFKLFNVQPNEAGNYTCKPTSAEPATIRLTVKKTNKSAKERLQQNSGYHSTTSKEAQRNRQHYGFDSNGNSLELNDASGASPVYLISGNWIAKMTTLTSCLLTTLIMIV